MENLYRVEEFCTMGWEVVKDQLTRAEASTLLESMLDQGHNPNHLRAVRDD